MQNASTREQTAAHEDAVVIDANPRISEDLRSAVLAAAAQVFDVVGYHNASMGAIADRVGVSKTAVLGLYRAKHEILHEIHDSWIDELLSMASHHDEPPDAFCAAIRAYIFDILTVIERRRGSVRLYFESYRDLPPDLQKHAKAKRDLYEAQVEGVIRRGIESGVFLPQSARVAAFALFGMCNWTYQWYRSAGRLSVNDIAAQMCGIYLRGMCVRPEDAIDE